MTNISNVFEDEQMNSVSNVFEDEGISRSTDDVNQDELHSYTRDQILQDPAKMDALRQYMVERKGVNWETEDPDKLFDTYMSHMRGVNTNELRTLSEALYINRGTDEQKAKAGAAYNIYDEMKPFWSSGEGASALVDYGREILLSPSTYLGAVAGKGLVSLGNKAASRMIMQAAKEAAITGGEQAGRKVISEALKVGAVGTAIDSGMAVGQDLALQDTMMKAGAQDDYSPLQTALALTGGVAGGALGMGFELRRGSLGIGADAIEKSKAIRKSRATGLAAPRLKAAVQALAEQTKPVLGSGSIDWQKAVEAGAEANPKLSQLTDNMSWFFDVDNPDSLVRIIVDSGADLTRDKDTSFTESVLGFMNDIEPDQLKEINDVLEPATGLKLGQLVDLVAAGQSRAGTIHNVASQASKYANDYANITKATAGANKSVVDDLINGSDDVAKDPEYARYMASLWRRMIVSHPATTALNVKGWAMATTARAMAEAVNAGIVGTMGVVGKAVGAKWGDAALRTSRHSLANQWFKAKTLLDPYESKETFDALLKNAPKRVQDKVLAESYGGVNRNSAAKIFGLNENNIAVKGMETTADVASKLSLMHVQDLWTKTFSGLGSLDNQVRKGYNKSLSQLIQDGEYYKITDDMWATTLKDMNQDTFSHDYTRDKAFLNLDKFAGLVEKASNTPYLGFVLPFGRFMNNNIAFTLQYSPLAFMPIAGKMRKLGIQGFTKNTDDIGTDVGKAIVGTVGLATLIHESMKMRDSGFQWFEQEDSQGNITNEQNMAPYSQYKLLAHIGDRLAAGEGVPAALWKDLVSQTGFEQWSKELSGDNLKAMIDYFSKSSDQTDTEGGDDGISLLGAALQTVSGIGSGFTRPLDPLNKVVGMMTGNDAIIDRRQAEPGLDAATQELTRYTDKIFGSLLGEDIGTPLRQATRPEGNIYNPNDMATMVGRKEVLPKNYTDKVLGMVDKPAYLMDQRTGNPAADRFMNEKVAPILNARSKNLLNDDVFKGATLSTKTYMVDEMLRKARSDVRDLLNSGRIGTIDDRTEDARRMWLGQPEALRTQVKKDLGINKPDNELTKDEIDLLRKYVGYTRKFLGNRVD